MISNGLTTSQTESDDDTNLEMIDLGIPGTVMNFRNSMAAFDFNINGCALKDEITSSSGTDPMASGSSPLRRSPRKHPLSQKTAFGETEKKPILSSLGNLKRKIEEAAMNDSDLDFPTSESRNSTKRTLSPSKKVKRGYADPTIYSHLRELNDYLMPDLDILFCGINPGQKSAEFGHHYANPTNHFWSCLHESGLTPTRLMPQEDHTLPESYKIGLTNLVDRPTVEASELSKAEYKESVPSFLSKVCKYHPRIVCLVGLSIADSVQSYVLKEHNKTTKAKAKSKLKTPIGILPFKIVHSKPSNETSGPMRIIETVFFALSSTSGRVVQYQKSEKIKQFKLLKELRDQINNSAFDSSHLLPIQGILNGPRVE